MKFFRRKTKQILELLLSRLFPESFIFGCGRKVWSEQNHDKGTQKNDLLMTANKELSIKMRSGKSFFFFAKTYSLFDVKFDWLTNN